MWVFNSLLIAVPHFAHRVNFPLWKNVVTTQPFSYPKKPTIFSSWGDIISHTWYNRSHWYPQSTFYWATRVDTCDFFFKSHMVAPTVEPPTFHNVFKAITTLLTPKYELDSSRAWKYSISSFMYLENHFIIWSIHIENYMFQGLHFSYKRKPWAAFIREKYREK